MQKKTGLGRGMNAILGSTNTEFSRQKNNSSAANKEKEDVSRETSFIKLSLIEPNRLQPRKIFDEEKMKELAESIKEHGVLQPILVRKKDQMYEIIVGERRWRAAKIAGLKEIPAIVKEMTSKEASETALIENIQREDLNSVEEAKAYKSLIDEYGMTQDELAGRLAKNRTTITNSLRLLQLEDNILQYIIDGELSAGHARAILAVKDKENQYKAAREVIDRQLNVRQTEKLAKSYNEKKIKEEKINSDEEENREMYITAVENELTETMKTRVRIKQTGKQKGRIEIEYYSDEELNNLIERLR